VITWEESETIATSTTIGASGYKLYMDGGNDGNFNLVYDGTNQPGILSASLDVSKVGIQIGRVYRFKSSVLNFNGESEYSDETLIFACLPPSDFSAPQYVSSTETTLTISWSLPSQ
jgi:hypothetical protein